MDGRGRKKIVCGTVLIALLSCQPSAQKKAETEKPLERFNVVVVTVDTLRADRIHAYGNANIETPALDGLARTGAQFENAVAQTPLTPPSHASIFTGTNPNVHMVRNTGGFVLSPTATTLAKILKAQGWDTAAFVGAAVLKKSFGFSQGFDLYDDEMPKAGAGREDGESAERRAGVVVDHALRWLGGQTGKPFFVWVHLYDPHEPYRPPPPFFENYRKNLYDGEVAYSDHQLGRLFEGIAKKAPADKTLIVVLADHGESLGEHGEFNHGVFLYDSTLRIPLLMKGPGIPVVRVTQQARTIDVLPTILDFLGGSAPSGCQGVSLKRAMYGRPVETTYSYEETAYPKLNMGWADLRAVRTSRWKYVHAPKPELYDLTNDPGEKTNVIASHPGEVQELKSQLSKLSAGGLGTESIAPLNMDAKTLDQLKSLGYLSGAGTGSVALNGKGADPKDHVASLLAFQYALGPNSRALSQAKRIEVLREALAHDDSNPSLYFYLAAEYEKAGKYEQAMAVGENARQHGVVSGRLLSRMGDLYLRAGRKDEAIGAYEKAAQANPGDFESQTNLGTVYLEKGNLADAERRFRWALSVEGYAPADNGLGLVAIQRHDAGAAREHFERAVALDPGLVEAQLNLGLLYKMAGDIPRAKVCFEAFLARASQKQYREVILQVKQELEATH